MNDPDPMPRDFGLRWIMWMAWSNAVTILAILQGIFASLLLVGDDPNNPLFSHNAFRYIMLGNAILTGLVAQLKKNHPPPPPPTQGQPFSTVLKPL